MITGPGPSSDYPLGNASDSNKAVLVDKVVPSAFKWRRDIKNRQLQPTNF